MDKAAERGKQALQTRKSDRKARLAAELRENLKRRKAATKRPSIGANRDDPANNNDQ